MSLLPSSGSSSITLLSIIVCLKFAVKTNSYFPANSSKIRIPRDQKSTAKSCPWFLMISGGMYSGVPTNEYVFSPRTISLAKPKSTCTIEEAGTLTLARDATCTHSWDTRSKIKESPVWRSPLHPASGSRASGLCTWCSSCAGKRRPPPRRRCRTQPWAHQSALWKPKD